MERRLALALDSVPEQMSSRAVLELDDPEVRVEVPLAREIETGLGLVDRMAETV